MRFQHVHNVRSLVFFLKRYVFGAVSKKKVRLLIMFLKITYKYSEVRLWDLFIQIHFYSWRHNGLSAGVRFPAEARDISLLQGPSSPPIQWGAGDSFPRRDADLSSKSNAGVKNGGAIPPLPHVSSWHNA
jgi:hypothetical protein